MRVLLRPDPTLKSGITPGLRTLQKPEEPRESVPLVNRGVVGAPNEPIEPALLTNSPTG